VAPAAHDEEEHIPFVYVQALQVVVPVQQHLHPAPSSLLPAIIIFISILFILPCILARLIFTVFIKIKFYFIK